MARSTRTNHAKATIWTPRVRSEVEGTIAAVSLMAFQAIETVEDREEVLKHMNTWHKSLSEAQQNA